MLVVFAVSAVAGYRLISNVPSLLHTPLMSGMNALSGITVLGAMVVAALAVSTGTKAMGVLAVALAAVNLVGGFVVTDRMLGMFKRRK